MERRLLTDFKILTLDCYGTLIDWESGIWDALQPLLLQNQCKEVTRESALQLFSVFETRQQRETPRMFYPLLLSCVHALIAEHLRLSTTDRLNKAFGQSLAYWPAFPDATDALHTLKRHFPLVVLSNVHRDGFAWSAEKLGIDFDAVYTAEDIGSYKPALENFRYMIRRIQSDFEIKSTDILHTAQSLHHDHLPAKELGLTTTWIDRQRLSQGGNWGATFKVSFQPDIDYVYFSLREMSLAVEKQFPVQ